MTTEYTLSYIDEALHDNTFVLMLEKIARTANKICLNIYQMLTLSKCLYNYKFISRLENSQAIKSSIFTICPTNVQIIKSFFFIHPIKKVTNLHVWPWNIARTWSFLTSKNFILSRNALVLQFCILLLLYFYFLCYFALWRPPLSFIKY